MSIDIVEPRSILMKSRRHKHIQNLSTGATWQCVGIKAEEISRPQHLQKPVSSIRLADWHLFHAASTRRAISTRHAWILCYKSARVSRVFPCPHRFHAFFPPPGYNTHTVTFRHFHAPCVDFVL